MKKRITLLALVLAVCLGCAGMTGAFPAARAELPLVYPAETVISVIRLTEVQRSLAEYLYRPVLAGETKITLPEGTRYDDVGPALQSLMLDYPELFHLGHTYTITYWQNEPDVAIAVSPAYRMDARTADALRQQLYGSVLTLVQADGTAVGLHDALVERVTYGGTDDMRHTAVGALLYGTATCEGYAQALSLLYRMAGIPCGVVTGSAFSGLSRQWESHAWNVMNLGGFSLIDATWRAQGSTPAGISACPPGRWLPTMCRTRTWPSLSAPTMRAGMSARAAVPQWQRMCSLPCSSW